MKNRAPVPPAERPPLPAFDPVPRRARHDGWTPERQKAFIEALADTGSVSRACAMVNMASVGAYYLRRQPGADSFRRAWEAALDYGVARMKDIAFERAVEGYLVHMFVGGKLIGWRRKYNDRLLMFCLRHYGEDANGKRTTVNYFSTRATAGGATQSSPERGGGPAQLVEGPTGSPTPSLSQGDGEVAPAQAGVGGAIAATSAHPTAVAEASATVVRTTLSAHTGPDELAEGLGRTAAAIAAFEGVELDDAAQAEIRAVLERCAARQRLVEGTHHDEAEPFIAAIPERTQHWVREPGYNDKIEEWRRADPVYPVAVHPAMMVEHDIGHDLASTDIYRSHDGEMDWTLLDDEATMAEIEAIGERIKAGKALAAPEPASPPSVVPDPIRDPPL